METFLTKYSKYLISNKEAVSIRNSQIFISINDDYNIDEIISYFKRNLDVQYILSLVYNKDFYKGHSFSSKCSLLTQFYDIIYNYARNLIVNYEVFSTKILKNSTPNVAKCLVYIPGYSNYLVNLLGYNYDRQNDKWYIDTDNQLLTEFHLAGVCILCSYGSKILSDEMVETRFSDSDESEEHDTNPDNGNDGKSFDIQNDKDIWKCKICSFINEKNSKNCAVCFNSVEVTIPVTIEQDFNGRDSSEENNKNCEKVTNSNENLVCMADENFSGIEDEEFSDFFIDTNNNNWKCEACSYVNVISSVNCIICYNPMKNVEDLVNREEKPDEINQWKCNECTQQKKCKTCSRKRNANECNNEENPQKKNRHNNYDTNEVTNKQYDSEENSVAYSRITKKENQSNKQVPSKENENHRKFKERSSFYENLIDNNEEINKVYLLPNKSIQWKCEKCAKFQKECETCSRERNANKYNSKENPLNAKTQHPNNNSYNQFRNGPPTNNKNTVNYSKSLRADKNIAPTISDNREFLSRDKASVDKQPILLKKHIEPTRTSRSPQRMIIDDKNTMKMCRKCKDYKIIIRNGKCKGCQSLNFKFIRLFSCVNSE